MAITAFIFLQCSSQSLEHTQPILLSSHLNTKTTSSNYQYTHTPTNLIIDNNLVFNMRKNEVIKTHLF